MRVTIGALTLVVLAAAAVADEVHGPEFGATRIVSEIAAVGGESDVDDYVADLAQGERLTVTVGATRRSRLQPRVTLIDPDGVERDTGASIRRRGKLMRFGGFEIDQTGRWALRIEPADENDGRYSLRTSVKPAPRFLDRFVELGGVEPLEKEWEIEAVDGAFLTVTVISKRGGEIVEVLGLRGASGAEMAINPVARRRVVTLRARRLNEGSGTYRLRLGIASGSANAILRISQRTPAERPRGRRAVSGEEPYLDARVEPLEGAFQDLVTLIGGGFGEDLPSVFFGGEPASAQSFTSGGAGVRVRPPPFEIGTVVSVRVVDALGQSNCRDAHFRYVEGDDPPPPPPEDVKVRSLQPESAVLAAGAQQVFTVGLNLPAPVGGAIVSVTQNGGVGSVPASVTVPAGDTTAQFTLTAGANSAVGRVTASRGSSIFSSVTVQGDDPPPPPGSAKIDISGWTVRQANATWTYTFPPGSEVEEGGYVIVARNAPKAAFETYWGVTLRSSVLYFDTLDGCPKINGSETYELLDDSGNSVDGPTTAMRSSAKQNFQRTPGAAAGLAGSWTTASSVVANASPGAGQPAPDTPNGIYISEFSDTTPSGTFIYEFVELHFDGPKP